MSIQRKEKTLYRGIMRGAWEISWHHKRLWVLGFFAALLGNGGAVDFIIKNAGRFDTRVPQLTEVSASAVLSRIMHASGTPVQNVTAVIAALFFAALAIVGIVLAVSAVGGILIATNRIVLKKKMTIRDAFRAGAVRFWPMLGVQLLGWIATGLLLAMTAGAVLSAGRTPGALATYLVSFVLFCALALVVSVLTAIASAAVATKDVSVREAFAEAWLLLGRHWLVCVEMIALLFAVNIVVTVGAFILLAVLAIPFFLLSAATAIIGSATLLAAVSLLSAVALILVLALAGSALAVFMNAAWALLYLRLPERGALSKLARIFHIGRA